MTVAVTRVQVLINVFANKYEDVQVVQKDNIRYHKSETHQHLIEYVHQQAGSVIYKSKHNVVSNITFVQNSVQLVKVNRSIKYEFSALNRMIKHEIISISCIVNTCK